MTELPATTYRDRDTQDPWERFDWIMGAIWLVFLLFPLAAAFTVEATWAGHAFAVASILGSGHLSSPSATRGLAAVTGTSSGCTTATTPVAAVLDLGLLRARAAYPPCMPDRPVFVLHEHDRPRHHFDLRLEEEGVLRSWAVPKGLPEDHAHDRLAVPVDDHEVEHATYEDDTKRIADTGWWELESRTSRRFVFVLHGRESVRRYALIDTGGQALLHLTRGQPSH